MTCGGGPPVPGAGAGGGPPVPGAGAGRAHGFAVISPREASILAALADAAAAPEPPLPPVAATDAAAAFDAWLAAAPHRNRVALRAALLALERLSGPRRFRSLDRDGRLAVVRRVQRSRVPLVPQLTEALRSAALVSYHGDARVMAALGYDAEARVRELRARRAAAMKRDRRPPATADGRLRAATTDDGGRAATTDDGRRAATTDDGRRAATTDDGRRPTTTGRRRAATTSFSDAGLETTGDGYIDAATGTLRADVVVIGSGAGGAVVAKELAEGGARVVVLEEGGRHDFDSLTGRPRDMMARLYRDGGQIATLGRPPIVLPLGRGVGGTTLVNSGTCFRTPDRVLERWQADFGLEQLGPQQLAPVFDRVERTLGVAEVPPEIAGANAALTRRGAERLGWSGGYVRRNARGCQGSGVCAFGCPTGAKQHAGDAYLAPARKAGALTCTGARATNVLTRKGRATAVEARTANGRLTVEADTVVVAAGTIHTPLLLAANQLGGGSGQLGENLSLHPASAVWGLFDEPVDMANGVPQAYFVDEFAPQGIMLEGIAGPPDYLAMAAPFTGDRHRELMLRYRNVGQCGMMVSDRSRGRVRGRPDSPLIRYDLCREDVATLHAALVRLAELLAAAGATALYLPLARMPELPHADPTPLRALDLRRGDLKLMAFHPLGTARAHATPDRGVVDENLRVHGTDNVYVADGSAVPSALGVNPQITIMALATRLAFHLRGEPCPS
jgi:choline dehydrogenase-like flavoprotein